jgi:hypothetical protein
LMLQYEQLFGRGQKIWAPSAARIFSIRCLSEESLDYQHARQENVFKYRCLHKVTTLHKMGAPIQVPSNAKRQAARRPLGLNQCPRTKDKAPSVTHLIASVSSTSSDCVSPQLAQPVCCRRHGNRPGP